VDFPNRFSSTTSLSTRKPLEKAYCEQLVVDKSQSLVPILSLFDPNISNIWHHFVLIFLSLVVREPV
jgi:hypothetical protein